MQTETFDLTKAQIPQLIKWLQENGYRLDGHGEPFRVMLRVYYKNA